MTIISHIAYSKKCIVTIEGQHEFEFSTTGGTRQFLMIGNRAINVKIRYGPFKHIKKNESKSSTLREYDNHRCHRVTCHLTINSKLVVSVIVHKESKNLLFCFKKQVMVLVLWLL